MLVKKELYHIMTSDRPSVYLGAMLNCEDRGAYRTMRVHLEHNSKTILDNGDISQIRSFAELLLRVIKAIDEEHEKGEGSLFKHDHPHNIEWKNSKPIKIEMIEE